MAHNIKCWWRWW